MVTLYRDYISSVVFEVIEDILEIVEEGVLGVMILEFHVDVLGSVVLHTRDGGTVA